MKSLGSKIIAFCFLLAIIAFSFSFYGVYTRLALMEAENHNYKLVIEEYNATVADLKEQLIKVVGIANKNADVAIKPISDKEKLKRVTKVKIKKEGNDEESNKLNDDNLTSELDRMWSESVHKPAHVE